MTKTKTTAKTYEKSLKNYLRLVTHETCDPNNSSLRLQGAKVHLMLSNGQEREKDARTGEERGRALSSLR